MDKHQQHKIIKPAKHYPKYFPNDPKMMFILPMNQDTFVPMHTQWETVVTPAQCEQERINNDRFTNIKKWGDAVQPVSLEVHHLQNNQISKGRSKIFENDSQLYQFSGYRQPLINSITAPITSQPPIELSSESISLKSLNEVHKELIDLSKSYKVTPRIEEDKHEVNQNSQNKEDTASLYSADMIEIESDTGKEHTDQEFEMPMDKMFKSHTNYLTNPNMVIALSDLYKNELNDEESEMPDFMIFESHVFKNLKMAKIEFTRMKT